MEHKIILPELGSFEIGLLWIVLVCAFIGIAYGIYLARKVLIASPGSQKMQDVSAAIQEGANAYLGRQFRTMIFFVILVTIGLFFMYRSIYMDIENGIILALGVAIAFLMGVFASYIAGFVGMWVAVRANVRVAHAALTSFKKALEIAFQGGTVSGMFTIGLGLIGATIIFLVFRENAMKVLVGFGFGGCLAALFMRMGGGIYTKAADVGADLVGKVEKDIPEDDPRNAATIADNVGDNVGDCAGMAADVFESYEVTLVAAIILGAACMLNQNFLETYKGIPGGPPAFALKLIIFPLLVRAIGVFASIFGTWSVRGKEDMSDPMVPINIGFWVSAIAALIGIFFINWFYLRHPDGTPDLRFFYACTAGIVLALVTLWITDYYTHIDKPSVTETAYSTKTGVATMILSGLAQGFQSSVWAILAIAGTILASLIIFKGNLALQMYGIALTGLGLLTTTGYILAMDTYGPVTDNANGIFEMSGALKEAEEGERAYRIVAKLDAIGNTTKALTKGLAIATAVIAATSLFSSFTADAHLIPDLPKTLANMKDLMILGIQVNFPNVFIGLLIGGAVPFLFSSFAINAVGRAAFLVVEEVRRQFKEIPGIMEGKNKPDYSKCVDISTSAAQKELMGPGILAIATPILVGFLLGATALGAYLAGAILTGQLLAVFMANAGGIWDNAKKKIEEGLFGGKGTEFHKAGVIGDTVGDPLKDTAGPAINPLIKVMNLVALLIAPIVITVETTMNPVLRWGVAIIMLILLVIAVWFSNRGSIVTEKARKSVDEQTGETRE
ncbi:MAG: sodium-translocating pyrophosphatase [Candidatus Eremiobacteraeota bacterium]|nr:sodium-translocating pyrophosphatase [Candidatus Eremiobacteraeota bacterium]